MCQALEPKRLAFPPPAPFCFAFQLCLPFLFVLTADFDGGNNKSPVFDGQVKKLGRLPAKLLQTKVGKVGLRVTVLNQFFASFTSSLSSLKPLTLSTSAM